MPCLAHIRKNCSLNIWGTNEGVLTAQTPSLDVVFFHTGLQGAPASPDKQTRIYTDTTSTWWERQKPKERGIESQREVVTDWGQEHRERREEGDTVVVYRGLGWWEWTETQREQGRDWDPKRGGVRGRDKLEDWDWHIHTNIYKIITNKDLLYSPGNSTQYSVMTYMGKESKKEIHVYV